MCVLLVREYSDHFTFSWSFACFLCLVCVVPWCIQRTSHCDKSIHSALDLVGFYYNDKIIQQARFGYMGNRQNLS